MKSLDNLKELYDNKEVIKWANKQGIDVYDLVNQILLVELTNILTNIDFNTQPR